MTDLFIKKPIMALVVNLLLVVGGLQAIRSLSVRQYPQIESSTVIITTAYVGANAELIRGFITTPLERAIASADGIDYIESSSTQGLSTIKVRLKLNFPAADALADINTRVSQVRPDLPVEAQAPSIRVEPSDGEVASMYLSFASDTLQDNQLTEYLERVVQPRLASLEGVQRAEIQGGQGYALRAWLNPDRMAAQGVTPSMVRLALERNHRLSALGQTRGALVQVNLRTTADLRSVEEFEDLVIRRDGDTLVRLRDIARVVLGAESYDVGARYDGAPAIFCGVWVRPNANSLDVAARVRAELETIRADLPAGTHSAVAYDATRYIDHSLREVGTTLVETIAIVVVVLFLFLGSLRTVVVPIVTIPLSLLGAIFLMQAMGFSVNLLTLLAIVLAVGLVVDDAIVVVENVDRYVREGRSPIRAAMDAARELLGPVVAMTITLAAVYAPIGLQGGLTGALFREFAFTLAGAVLISGVVALTLSPVMSAMMLKKHDRRGWLGGVIDKAFGRVRAWYARTLEWTLARRKLMLGVWAVLSLMVVPMYALSPTELAPIEDQGSIFVSSDVPPSASMEQIDAHSARVDEVFAGLPEYEHTWRIVTPGSAFGGVDLADWSERERSVYEINEEVAGQVAGIAGVRGTPILPAPLPSAGLFPVEFVIASYLEHDELLAAAYRIQEAAMASGHFAFPPLIDTHIDQEEVSLVLDRSRINAMGLTLSEVAADLSTMLSGAYVGRFERDGRSYKIIPQVERAARLTAEQLDSIHITGPDNTLIPVSAVAHLEHGVGARTLGRFGQLNAVRLSGIATRSLGAALDTLDAIAVEQLSPEMRVDYAGESRQLKQEAGKFLPAMALAIVLIFFVLAAQFNSLRDPAVILLGSVPLAMFGALIFTFLKFSGPPGLRFELTEGWTTTLNIYSQVGLVTLVGLVAKNGILIVEHAKSAQERGASKKEAIREAADARLRPILMTTVATVAGHFPLTLVSGPGAAARNSVGLILVGGMAVGTLFTLFIVPTIYLALAKDRRARAGKSGDGEGRRDKQSEGGDGSSAGDGEDPNPEPVGPARSLEDVSPLVESPA